jgi:hypothetical protein
VRFEARKLQLLRFRGEQEMCTINIEHISSVGPPAKRAKTSSGSRSAGTGNSIHRSLELPVSPCNDPVELVIWRVGCCGSAAQPACLCCCPATGQAPAPPERARALVACRVLPPPCT